MKRKSEIINTIISALRTYEIELIVPKEKEDTAIDFAIRTEIIFNSFTKKELMPAYEKAITRLKYNDIGLIA